MEHELRRFLLQLNAEVRDQAHVGTDDTRPDFSDNVFTEHVGGHLIDVGAIEDCEVCHHEGKVGQGIVKVNGYSLAEDDERLDLLTVHFVDNSEPPSLTTELALRLAHRAARLLESVRRKQHEVMDPASDERGMFQRIHDALPALLRVRVHVLTNCIAVVKEIAPEVVAGIPVSYEVWDLQRLHRSMAAGLPREDIEIDFEAMFGAPIPCVASPEQAGHQSYLAILPGLVLAQLYKRYGARLLEYNVRAFLQATGKVNRGIRDTLRNEPDRFMAYNNGISAIVDTLDTAVDRGQLVIRRVKGLQIVNGGQTTASLHRAGGDTVDLSIVSVAAKITVVRHDLVDQIVPRISMYANTQNVVQVADYSANEPFHIQLERLADTIWCPGERQRWFYERARGQYQVARARASTAPQRRYFKDQTPPQRKVTKTDLARYLMAWDQLPHSVSAGAQKNFVRFMRDLRQRRAKDWLPDETYYQEAIAKTILFKTVEQIVRRSELQGYRSQTAAYLVAYLSLRTGMLVNLDMIWSSQTLSPALQTLLKSWVDPIARALVDTAGRFNVGEWCKKDACWEQIAMRQFNLPAPLPPELVDVGHSKTTRATPSAINGLDGPVVAQVKSLSADDWFAIHTWGRRTGLLAAWQVGIAHTLSGYASGGWEKEPSPKQLKHAVRILSIARDHGQPAETSGERDAEART